MTEQEWLEGINPEPILDFLAGKGSERKLRLFACACSRQTLCFVADERAKAIIDVAERLADGVATNAERREAAVRINDHQIGGAEVGSAWGAVCCTVALSAVQAAASCSRSAATAHGFATITTYGNRNAYYAAVEAGATKERMAQIPFLRDIFGNPFRPVSINPAWLTPTVISLAQAAYEERNLPSGTLDNARLAVLADALEECGCDNADIPNHLRQAGEHYRGCWVVDALLGKR
jgi:hypothetical protein